MSDSPRRAASMTVGLATLLSFLAVGAPAADENDKSGQLSGGFVLAYRDVDVDGSRAKFDEGFDGLDSGIRLEELRLEWSAPTGEARFSDHVRLFASGLGGDPDEHVRFDMSRRDRYELSLHHDSRRYRYDLFGLLGDEDGHSFRSRSERNGLSLRWHAAPGADVVLAVDRNRRSGDRVFMKDISRDVFLLDAPIDQEAVTYSVGANLDLGDVRLSIRQAVRDADRRFANHAENAPGLDDTDSTELDRYDWLEVNESRAHLTTIRLWAPIGDRVHVRAGYHGTLFGSEDFDSRARQDAVGVAFNGMPLVIDGGVSTAHVDRDRHVLDGEIAVRASDEVTLRLGWRFLDLSDDGHLLQDLEGSGTTTEKAVRLGLSRDTLTALVEVRPVDRFAMRLGYRLSDRELSREGYEGQREPDFRSESDASFVVGLSWRPVDWFRLGADHEQEDLDAAFSELSALDRSRTRLRLSFRPRNGFSGGLTWRSTERENPTVASRSDVTDWSASLRHEPNERVTWGLSWTHQEIHRVADVIFDGAAFGGPGATFPGATLHDVDLDHLSGFLELTLPHQWSVTARLDLVESRGRELASGDDPNNPPAVPSEISRDQDWTDHELTVERMFGSGLSLGAGLRRVDSDDPNPLLDHDTSILTFRVGYRF